MTVDELKITHPVPAELLDHYDIQQAGNQLLTFLDEIRDGGNRQFADAIALQEASTKRLSDSLQDSYKRYEPYKNLFRHLDQWIESYGESYSADKAALTHNVASQRQRESWCIQSYIGKRPPLYLWTMPLGKTLSEIRSLHEAEYTDTRLVWEAAQIRYLKAKYILGLMHLALDLSLTGETIEGLEVGSIPVPEPSRSWRDRHQRYERWVLTTYRSLYSDYDSDEKRVRKIIELYEERITPKLESHFPDKVKENRHEMIISRDTARRYCGLKKK